MNISRRTLGALAIAALVFAVAGCGTTNDQLQHDQETVQKQQDQYAQVEPIPFFDWSQDRAVFIQIYQAKNDARNTWSVVTSAGTGEVLFMCPSIGYPIPADTQLTNPMQITRVKAGSDWSTWNAVPQAEPNGLYSSTNTDATYVLCVMSNGDKTPLYTEQKVTAFAFPVSIVDGKIVQGSGNATITVDVTKPTNLPTAAPSTK